jgi:hypothetical protein
MRMVTILLLINTAVATCVSQGVFTNHTNEALQKVIGDYPNHLRNIKGVMIRRDVQTIDFESKVEIPGALQCVVIQYTPANEEIYSWKCLMFESEHFETVKTRYKELYDQIKNSIIKISGQKPFILIGSYGMPSEERKSSGSSFHLLPAFGEMQNLTVELTVQNLVVGWKIELMVYENENKGVGLSSQATIPQVDRY